jgi:magnesium chelatase subunit D
MFREFIPQNAPVYRVPLGIGDDRLLGGLDLAATLRASRPIASMGIMAQADGGVLVLAMAERMSKATGARIAAAMDDGETIMQRDGFALKQSARFAVIALDEGQGDDERIPDALADRLAFYIDLDQVGYRDAVESSWSVSDVSAARERLARVSVGDPVIEALVSVAAKLGIGSSRAPLLALKVARAACALRGGSEVDEDDLSIAAGFVLAPRALVSPVPPQSEETPDQSSGADASAAETQDDSASAEPGQDDSAPQELQDVVIAAVQAAIPAGLLEQLQFKTSGASKGERGGKAETKATSARRGRPMAARCGQLRDGRLSLVDTLRAAAPWQRLRRNIDDQRTVQRVIVRPEDFRIVRYRERRETTTIFVVDASGSSAMQRLAEVKGSIELLLADCYVRRDLVAMIVFRGIEAEVVLPPTRSLVRAKRLLAGLPGGGGTPIASGLDMAVSLAESLSRKGQSPLLVLMTDGRANIRSDGKSGRAQAFDDALRAGERVTMAGISALAIDTSPLLTTLGEPPTLRLARAMNARYMQLPYADAVGVSEAVRAASLRP